MSIIRWEPFNEMITLRHSMDRIFEDVFTPRSRPRTAAPLIWQPAVEIFDASDRVVARFEVPGADPGTIEVSVNHQRLTVRGRVLGHPVPGATYHLRELRYGPFERSIPLPPGLIADDATAGFRQGVLEVRIRKVGRVHPFAVPIEIHE